MVQESGFQFSAALNTFGLFLTGENSPYSEKKKYSYSYTIAAVCGFYIYHEILSFPRAIRCLFIRRTPLHLNKTQTNCWASRDLSSKSNNISVKFKQFLLSTFLFSLMTSLWLTSSDRMAFCAPTKRVELSLLSSRAVVLWRSPWPKWSRGLSVESGHKHTETTAAVTV